MGKELINLSNLQRFLSKLNEKFALKKAMKGISEDAEGNIIIGEEGLVPTPNENSKGKFLRSDGEWALPSETAVYDSMTLEEGVAGVSKVDKVLSAKNLKQIVNSDGFLTSLDSSKLTGIINIENLPQGALERILIVSSKEERLTLLDTEVQLGDVVKESDTGLMYYVINTEKLNSEEGYTQFTAGSASSVPWSGVTDKPTIPTKTSDLTNDSDFAIDNDVVHKTGDETIAGNKTFQNTIYRKADITTSTVETVYKFEDTNAKPCGSIYNRMHWYNNDVYNRHQSYNATSGKDMYLEILSDNDGSGVVNTGGSVTNNKNLTTVTNSTNNSYVATMGWVNNPATSTNVVHRSGNETISGVKSFNNLMYIYDNMSNKNNQMDLFKTPANTLFSHYMFVDKNNEVSAYMQYGQQNTGTDFIGLFIHDKSRALHGLQVTSNNSVIPLTNNAYSLGGSANKWKNVYATTFNGNLKGNADSSTKATQDSAGQQINKTYIKELSVSGRTITYKRGDNTTGTITTQDTNTTYSKLSQFTNDTGFITSSGSCNYSNSAGNGIDSSGANYVKFKDGIQICFGANKGGDIVTFANAFRSTPIIAFGYNIGSDVDRVIHGQAKYSSSTSFTMQVWDFKSNTWSNERVAEWIAIGHWK